MTAMTAAVTPRAASAAGHIRARNWAPVRWSGSTTIRFAEVRAGKEQRAGVGEQ